MARSDGIELRSQMVADGRFAMRNDEGPQATLDNIQEGEGLDDLVQDLRELSAFAKQNKTALAAIGVKVAQRTKEAEKLASSLEEFVANRRTEEAEARKAVDLRDRASTYLLEAVREVRAAGVYAFRGGPQIVVRFRGAYEARRQSRRNKAKTQMQPPTATNGLPQA